MNAPEPPKNLTKEIIEKYFGPLPRCKHGFINSICELCNNFKTPD